uniref:Uncharacterized protein n=1 Tax=Anopheles coluzzii TaxID=1518534 RepID=A0A8W7PIW5_ANOCL
MAALAQPGQRFNDERKQQAKIVCQLLLDRIPGRILANVKHLLEPVDTGQQPFQLVAQIFLREPVDQIAQDGRWLLVGRAMVGPHHLHQIVQLEQLLRVRIDRQRTLQTKPSSNSSLRWRSGRRAFVASYERFSLTPPTPSPSSDSISACGSKYYCSLASWSEAPVAF